MDDQDDVRCDGGARKSLRGESQVAAGGTMVEADDGMQEVVVAGSQSPRQDDTCPEIGGKDGGAGAGDVDAVAVSDSQCGSSHQHRVGGHGSDKSERSAKVDNDAVMTAATPSAGGDIMGDSVEPLASDGAAANHALLLDGGNGQDMHPGVQSAQGGDVLGSAHVPQVPGSEENNEAMEAEAPPALLTDSSDAAASSSSDDSDSDSPDHQQALLFRPMSITEVLPPQMMDTWPSGHRPRMWRDSNVNPPDGSSTPVNAAGREGLAEGENRELEKEDTDPPPDLLTGSSESDSDGGHENDEDGARCGDGGNDEDTENELSDEEDGGPTIVWNSDTEAHEGDAEDDDEEEAENVTVAAFQVTVTFVTSGDNARLGPLHSLTTRFPPGPPGFEPRGPQQHRGRGPGLPHPDLHSMAEDHNPGCWSRSPSNNLPERPPSKARQTFGPLKRPPKKQALEVVRNILWDDGYMDALFAGLPGVDADNVSIKSTLHELRGTLPPFQNSKGSDV
eukprot:TRINITY_DN1119_c0_g1_i1.p1 TRINITY_DN1119_c0_g1~~TRINITY_DN1119_c0_g1_i1.p1  ORF type:complete len:572 (-),score=116.23 TRINITY_DN1119_c0_g1_i1:371-1885(-)